MKTNISDVAKYVGVSKSTVSQYINHRYEYMSVGTRQKIAEAIEKLDYHPNQIAKSLKQKRTNVIALVCATLSSRFSIELISSVEAFFRTKGYSVVVSRTNDDPEIERSLIDSFISRQIDGVIVFPTKENAGYYKALVADNYPIVFVDRYLEDVSISSVLLDNVTAICEATEYLIGKGHAKIGVVTLPLGDHITTRSERLKGYQKALTKHHIEVNDDYVVSCALEEVEASLQKMFSLPAPPSALLLTNDILLEGALSWLNDQPYQVGEDISLIAVDDVALSRFYKPAITTVAQPVDDIGIQASSFLLDKITHKETCLESEIVRLPAKLIERHSVRTV